MAGRELPSYVTRMEPQDVARVFASVWPGGGVSREALALVMAQSALETGRWKSMRDFNFGGVKSSTANDHQFFTTTECVSEARAAQAVAESTPGAWCVYADPTKYGKCDPGFVRVIVGAKHPWARFRAHETAAEAALSYLSVLHTKFPLAWQVLVTTADPTAYAIALKKQGYYTAPADAYAKNLVSLQREWLRTLTFPVGDISAVRPEVLRIPSTDPNAVGPSAPVPFVPPRGSSSTPAPPPAPSKLPPGTGGALVLLLLAGAAFAAFSSVKEAKAHATLARSR